MTKALEIKGLKKRYRSGTEALKGIDLAVETGDFFALLGPNGAGKSTTIGILTSLLSRSAGTVKVFGKDLGEESRQVKRMIGVVPQEFNFNIFETVENILFNQAGYYGLTRSEARPNIERFLKALGLWEKRKGKAQALSGGMKRRLMIARALIHNPKLLILDEPTAGVDIELRRSLWDFLIDLNKNENLTIILTTHYLEEAESLCRNIAIIDKGLIVRHSTMKSLLSELEKEHFILDLDTIADSLTGQLENFELKVVEEKSIEVTITKDNGLNELFTELTKKKINVLSLRNKANRLEELFVSLTNQGDN